MGKSKMSAMMAAAMMIAEFGMPIVHHRKVVDKKISDEEKQAKQRERNIRKGLKEFDIDGTKVWALNRNNAIKKLKKETLKHSERDTR